MKHTPWTIPPTNTVFDSRISKLGYDLEILAKDDDGGPIAICATKSEYASLIAATPEMLEALEAIIAACDEPTPHIPKIKHIAENAIAKTG